MPVWLAETRVVTPGLEVQWYSEMHWCGHEAKHAMCNWLQYCCWIQYCHYAGTSDGALGFHRCWCYYCWWENGKVSPQKEQGSIIKCTIYQGVQYLYKVSKLRGLVHRKLDCWLYDQRFETKDVRCKGRSKKIFQPQFLGITIHQEIPKLLLLQEHHSLVAKALDCQALWKAVAVVRDQPPAWTWT